ACAAPERPPTAVELAAAETGASEFVHEWAQTGSEGRWDDLVARYADAPGFAWIEQGENRYPDHAAIAAGVAQARDSGLSVRTTVSNVVATALSPDAAAVRADVSIAFGDPAAGGFAFSGILTGVAIRREGRWMFLQGHLSSPQPPAPPSAAQ
ncbi:MAG: nuclear transport factor 2 family protein, partial [Caulobacteraceae bacterium]